VNQEESEHNEADGMMKGADSTGKVDAYLKERLCLGLSISFEPSTKLSFKLSCISHLRLSRPPIGVFRQ